MRTLRNRRSWFVARGSKIQVHKARSFEDAERFDAQFWRRAGAAARFSATWLMVEEFLKLRRKSRGQLRLRRTVQHIQRT